MNRVKLASTLLFSLAIGCVEPDAKPRMDVMAAVEFLESNGGEWTPEVVSTITEALKDPDYRIKSRGLVAIVSFPGSCPPAVRDLVREIAQNDPDTPGVQDALQALSSE